MASRDPLQTSSGGAEWSADQILVMHCNKEDSVLGQGGFSVRAASLQEDVVLNWALKHSPYELPFDMKGGSLMSSQAPRRLARVPAPSGRIALVSSSYVSEDTRGRADSYVSHLLIVRDIGVIDAVNAWNAIEWQTDEYPRGETKTLPKLDHLPRGTLINEAALTSFLRADAAPLDQSLAKIVFPVRVESDPESRRRWFRASLHAFLRTGEPNAQRTQVCVLAEPGVVALLVFAIARLLPRKLVDSFMFSTYEPPHSSLRNNTSARVIGSYSRNGLERNDTDVLRRRCYVVDTVRGDFNKPDLQFEADSWPLEDLLKLAARSASGSDESKKDWAEIDAIRDLWELDPEVKEGVPLKTLAEAVKLRPQDAALKARTMTVDGLREFARSRLGRDLLRRQEYRALAWEVLRRDWMRAGPEFADIVGDHRDELLEEARIQARSGSYDAWRSAWASLKTAIPEERRAAALETLLRAQGESSGGATMKAGERSVLLGEWAKLAPAGTALPAELHWLLRPRDQPAFLELLRLPGLDPYHAGLAACFALDGSSAWEAAPGIVNDLSPDQFRSFALALEHFATRGALLAKLFPAGAAPEPARLARFLAIQPALKDGWLASIVKAARCDEPQWTEYWLEGNHLASLLSRLSAGDLTDRIWSGLIAQITAENFMRVKTSDRLQKLAADCQRFPDHVPAADRTRLDAWIVLNRQFCTPEKPPTSTAVELERACLAVGQDTEDLVKQYLSHRFTNESDDLKRKKAAEILGHALRGFYASEDAACKLALHVAGGITDPGLAAQCKFELFSAIASNVSAEHWNSLFKTHASELQGTRITPRRVDVATNTKATKGGSPAKKKTSAAGAPWLSQEDKRIAVAFVGGMAFMALAGAVLWVVKGGSVTGGTVPAASAIVTEGENGQGNPENLKSSTTVPAEDSGFEVVAKGTLKGLEDQVDDLTKKLQTAKTRLRTNKKDSDPRVTRVPTKAAGDSTNGQAADLQIATDRGKPKDETGPSPIADTLSQPTPDGRRSEAMTGPTAPASPVTIAGDPPQQGPTPDGASPAAEPGPRPPADPTDLALNSTKAGAAAAPRKAGNVENQRRLLKNSILDTPLQSKDVGKALGFAQNLVALKPDDPAIAHTAETALRFLRGLSSHALIEKIKAEELKQNFGFLQTDDANASAIATLAKNGMPSYHRFTTENNDIQFFGRFPKAPNGPKYTFLEFSPSADVALGNPLETQILKIIECNKFYNYFYNYMRDPTPKPGSPLHTRELTSPVGGYFAISNKGAYLAVATPLDANDGKTLPRVDFYELSGVNRNVQAKQHASLDFSRFGKDLQYMVDELRATSWKFSKVSYDSSSQVLVVGVGLEGKSHLIATRPNDKNPRPWRIGNYSGPVLDWNLSPDGKYLAVAAGMSVCIEDIASLLSTGSSRTQALSTGHSNSQPRAVAFSSKGSVVATGDSDGVVAIHRRIDPSRGWEPANVEEVLRLAHGSGNRILKVGFSPDGRALAVLVETDRTEENNGTITLWVTKEWEKGGGATGEPAPASSPGALNGGGGAQRSGGQ